VQKLNHSCCDIIFLGVLAFILVSFCAPRPADAADAAVLVFPVLRYMIIFTAELRASARTMGPSGFKYVKGVPLRDLVDWDTPAAARSKRGFDGNAYTLVFSDEFNQDGRSFCAPRDVASSAECADPGDDPYFEAVDLWN